MDTNKEIIDQAVSVLNRALEKDREALSKLLLTRWKCSQLPLPSQAQEGVSSKKAMKK